MGEKGEGGIKNLKKWVMSFMNGPQVQTRRKIIMLGEVTWINICFALSSSLYIREGTSTKFVEYESLRVSNGWVRVRSSSSKIIECKSNMQIYTSAKYEYYQCGIPCNYWNSWVRVWSSSLKMVKCESNIWISKYSLNPYSIYVVSSKAYWKAPLLLISFWSWHVFKAFLAFF